MSRIRWSWSLAGALSLAVLSACPPPPPPAIAMPSDDLGDTTVGVAYTHTITATGGSGTLSYTATGLPAGLTMGASGTISGTATAPGDFSVAVTAGDTAGQTASATYPLKVYPAPALAPAALPDGTAGASYSATVSASGGKAPVVLSQSGGALPSGLTFNAATGVLSGTPDTAGASTFTLQARDANGAIASQGYTVTISAALALNATIPATANVGTAYSGLLTASGGKAPITYSVATGVLPPGLSLSATSGTITGTPTFAGAYSVTVAATDVNGAAATRTATINVFTSAPPAVVTTTLPNGVVGAAYTASLVAQFGRPPYAWSLGSGSSLPAGLSLAANGQITGTPTTTGPTDFQVVVTDANGQTATATLRITVSTGLTIITTSLPEGYATQAYPSTTVVAAGGQTPYSWSLSGALPSGLVFTSGTATISGTPAAGTAGSYGVTLTVTDGSGQTQSASFTITLHALPAVTTTTLADGSVGASYSQVLQASGGKAPLTWSVTTGALPAGILLDPNSGSLLGTPSAAGTSTFVVQVSDANGKTATKLLQIVVFNGLAVTYGPAPDGYTGTAYSQTLTAAGGRTPYTWALLSGSLPAGVTLNGGAGTLGGTPSGTGTSNFTLQVTDANNVTATKALTITVYAPPTVTTTTLADAYAGSAYSASVAGTGGKPPYTWAVVSGALPTGLSFDAGGVISGTLTATGTFTFTVRLTDANGVTATQGETLVVFPALQLTTGSLPDGYLTTPYTGVLAASGGKAPLTFSVAGALPNGLSLNAASGAITGTPTATGTASFTAQVTDANGRTSTAPLSIAVFALPSVTTTALPDAYAGGAYSAAVAGAGGKAPLTFAVTNGSLPVGLSMAAGGAIAGTPGGAPGTSTFTVTVTDANGITATRTLTITLLNALVVTTAGLADGYTSSAYSQALAATGGLAPYRWSSGALPPGLSLNTTTGAINGTPAATGTTTVTFTVFDANNATASRSLAITVYAPPQLTAGPLPDAYPSVSYVGTVAATGGKSPLSFGAGAGLPAGLLMSSAGAISGNTTASPGTASFSVTVTDANGITNSRPFSIIVRADVAVTTASLPDAYVTAGYSQTLAATGGKPAYTWVIGSGSLPAGVTLDGVAGVLSGSPTAAGTSSFTVRATDQNGVSASRALTIQTYALPVITTAALSDAVVNAVYNQPLAMTGGKAPFTWSLTGTLPAGVSFNTSTGVISGTPTVTGSYGPLVATVTDVNGRSSAPITYTLNVVSSVTVTTASINDAYQGIAFSQTLSAAGGAGAPFTFTLTAGALPAGLNLSSSGTISGTTTAATGSYTFTVTARDSGGANQGSKAFTQNVLAAPAITTSTLPDGYTDQGYSATLAGTGGKTPYTWSITAGGPSGGVTLASSTGIFSGTPTATGTFTLTLQLSDTNGVTASRTLTIASFAPPSQTSPAVLADAYTSTAYNLTLGVSGGKAPFTWSAAAGLPPGIALSTAGVLSGTATATGAFTFSTTAADANGRTAVMSHTINVFAPLNITTASPLPDGYRAVAYNQTLTATGGSPPLTWSVTSGALPAGLSMSAGGAITGTPTASGTFTFTATITDRNGTSANRVLTLTVQPPLTVTKTAMVDGYVGRAYSDSLTASGGRPPYLWAITSGALPAGLTLTPAGLVSGTPTAAGTSSFTVTLTDGNGTTATQALTLLVFPAPSITTTSFPDAYAGQPYSATAAGAGGKTPYTWSISAGALPAGLSLNNSTGAISGSAAAAGSSTFTLTLTDANGLTASQAFTITVFNSPAITSTSPLADGYAGQSYSFTFAATGGKAPLTWALTAGALPPGLTLSSSGVLSGTIGAAGQNVVWSFTVTVTDANGRTASTTFTMTTYVTPSISTTSLTTATEGVTYFKAPATPEQLAAANGKGPYTFSAGAGLPSGITLASATGILSGIPAQGTAGPHSVTFTVADANGKTGTATLNLPVKAAAPIYGGGTLGVAPNGSPITDTLTVFATDYENRRYANLGVRIRKNGVEYAPVKEALTDANGKVVFTGLGLNGTTDTVDVTVNGKDVANEAFLKVNAAIISVPMLDYPVPMPRSYANGEIDPPTGRLIVTNGFNPNQVGAPGINSLFSATQNDVVRLTDPLTGTWSEDVPPGLINAPPLRYQAGMAYANNVHVLFGGADVNLNALNDTWHYSVATSSWAQVFPTGTPPSPRDQFAMAAVGSQIILFGGRQGPFTPAPLNDLYAYNPATFQWQNLPPFGPGPSARSNMASASAQNQLWICGGIDSVGELNDCWSYDPASLLWQPRGSMPGTRQGASMAATTSGTVYVFGGTSLGVPRNDLLVFSGGVFNPVSAINPPPPREGAVFAAEPGTGRLILFGGQSNAFVYNDVWTFDPPTNTWTQRTATFNKAAVGFTLTGAITGGNGGTRSRVTVEASGLSGYTNRQVFNLTGGSGSYTMSGVPAGDTISLTVLNEDLNQAFPNREWSWIDLGVIATNVGGNLTQNVALPTGPMTAQLVSTTGSYTLPSGWLETAFGAALARMTRPGYANHPNGFYQVTTATKTFRSDYFPPAAGTSETLIPEVESLTVPNCELSLMFLYNVSPGPLAPLAFPPGPRSVTPGISACAWVGTGLQSTDVLQSPGSTGAPGVAVGDLSGDGIADIALLTSNQVLIFNGMSSGEGAFGGPSSTLFLPMGNANSLAVADFDKNGRPDMAVGITGTNQFAVFLQTAPGVFSPALTFGAGAPVQGLVAGDFNGDTNPDVVVITQSPNQINEITGRGDGTFNGFTTVFNGATTFTALAAAQFNGDAFTDIAYGQGSQLGFMRGTATTLQNAATVPLPTQVSSIATGDLDVDGVNDVAVALQSGGVQIELTRSNFSFVPGVSIGGLGPGPKLAIAELTGDGIKDLAVATQTNLLFVYRGTGGGNLSGFSSNFTFDQPGSIAVGDYNADGNADVVLGESVLGGIPSAELFAALRPIPVGTDTYSFAAPANTQIIFMERGPSGIAWDSEIYSRAAAGTVTTSFPALSTLKPGRPAPAGQIVSWSPNIYIGTPANVSMDNFANFRVKADAQTSLAGSPQYRR